MAEDEATPAPLPPPPPPPLLPSIPDEWPCALRQNSTAGRYVVAKQALQPGATVLTDRPYAAVVADAHRGYVCSRCLHVSSARVYQCGGCGEQARYCSEACMRQDAEAVHGQGECRALVGLARLGVDGDSQPMRLAVRIAVANAVRERRQQEDAAASSSPSPFHTPAFVRGLDHHFDEASPPVQQGVLAVARALGTYVEDVSGSISPPKRPLQASCDGRSNAFSHIN